MKNILRNLRLRKFRSNKFLRYALYSLGEIILIVIGILVALQLGDWNDTKKSRELERRILSDLKNEININLDGLHYVIEQKKDIVETCQIFLSKTGPKTKWDLDLNFDSLLVKTIVAGWKFKPQNGVLDDILSSGKLEIIKNDSLRYAISSISGYTARYQYEDDMVINDLHNSYLPFITKYFPIKNTNAYESGELSASQRKFPSEILNSKYTGAPELLLNNLEFENQINIQMMWVNFSLYHYDQQQIKYKEIMSMIDQELNDKSQYQD
jgi:hypothetical protein